MNLKHLSRVAAKALYNEKGIKVSYDNMNVAIAAVFNAIREHTPDGDVVISNFGTFKKRYINERTINSPFTGNVPKTIEAHFSPSFKPSPKYKATVRYSDVDF